MRRRRYAEPIVAVLVALQSAATIHVASYVAVANIADLGVGKLDLRLFAEEVRQAARPKAAIDVTFEPLEQAKDDAEPPPEPPPPPKAEKKAEKRRDEKREPEKKPDEKKPEPEKKIVIKLPQLAPQPTAPPPPPPPPEQDHRVAVEQHVEDKNQRENPDAKFIADQNNKVEEETQARQTNHEKNDKSSNPGPSKAHAPGEDPGDSDKNTIADSDDHAGNEKHAPGESAKKADSDVRKDDGKVASVDKTQPPNLPLAEKAGENGRSGPTVAANQPPVAPQPAPKPAPPPEAPKAQPDTQTAENGNYSVSPFKKLDPLASPKPESSATPPRVAEAPQAKPYSIPRLGGAPGPNGVNFNLSPGGAVASIGEDTIKKEREADGERRKSAHRGPWKPSGLDRIHSQIENYVASVKLGNTTALNTAARPFASYLNHIHNRLHPIFADEFLASLDGLPDANALNQPSLTTALEVVVDDEHGRIVKMGVVRTSGVTAFDIAALDAMDRAGPFGKPPAEIVSYDHRVYLWWEFHRKPEIACSTVNARPFKLAPKGDGAPADPVPLPGPRVPLDPREQGAPPPSRQGDRDVLPGGNRLGKGAPPSAPAAG